MNYFQSVKTKLLRKHTFNLTHENRFSCKFGKLIPFWIEETIPGDVISAGSTTLARLVPLVAPMMQKVNISTYYFYVPFRLVFPKWYDFESKGRLGTTDVQLPLFDLDGVCEALNNGGFETLTKPSQLMDYMGLPTQAGQGVNIKYDGISNLGTIDPVTGDPIVSGEFVNQMPFTAYQLIYDVYFRDQNLEDPLVEGKIPDDGNIVSEFYDAGDNSLPLYFGLRDAAWDKDYLTSALPFTQRGNPVNLPIDIEADAFLTEKATDRYTFVKSKRGLPIDDDYNNSNLQAYKDVDGQWKVKATLNDGSGDFEAPIFLDSLTLGNDVKVNVENGGIDIQALRNAFALQRYLENNAVSGVRPFEQVLRRFGVQIPDYKLSIPQYLGGSRVPMTIGEVFQTSEGQDTPLGTPAGRGVSLNGMEGFRNKFFDERGYIIGIAVVRPVASYTQGLRRMFTKSDIFDFFNPEFEMLGEQPIRNDEVFLGVDGQNTDDFGYQSRYSEYKTHLDEVHGDFRTYYDFWHMANIYTDRPELNANFIKCNPSNRVFADTNPDSDKILMQMSVNVIAKRPLKYLVS